jgi:cytidine deaminase
MVGAAVMSRATGAIYLGANLEGADYLGTHAEEAALSAMNMAGERVPSFLVCVGSLEGQEPQIGLAPCGNCRQKIWEFSSLSGAETRVVIRDPRDGRLYLAAIAELLPFAFGPADIGIDLDKYRD